MTKYVDECQAIMNDVWNDTRKLKAIKQFMQPLSRKTKTEAIKSLGDTLLRQGCVE